MFCVKAWFYLLIVLLPFAAHAQSEHYKTEGEITIQINPSLTIGSVVQAAMGISPDNLVASSKENYANALSNRSSSLFADTPELSFKHQNDNLISNQGLQEWESSLDMPLWMPGQKSAGRLKARMYERETAAFRKLSILQITGQVRELLWELKLADAVLLQSRENLLIAEALNNDIQKRIAAGNLPRRNSILGTKEVMNRKMEMVDAEAEYIHVAKRYESITGLVEIPDDIEEVIYASAENEDEAIDKAPIIEFARAKVEFMRAEFKEANSSWSSSPKLSVGVKRERGSFLDRNIDSVGIGLSLPFGATSHTTSKRAEASMALAQAERELQLTKRDYRLELHEAEHDLEICEIQLPYMKSHFELSQENLRLSQKAFNMGESDLLDLIKIQEQYVLSSAQNNKKIIECKRAIARQNQVQGVMVQ